MDDVKASLRLALRRFPAAVCVLAARAGDGGLIALTATAVTVLTFDPPTMLACVNKSSAFAAGLEGVAAFSINLLTTDQQAVSAACAGAVPQGQREAAARWHDGALGVPVLDHAQASLICRRQEVAVPGSHLLLLGAVAAVDAANGIRPLLYLDQAYGGFTALPAA